MSAKLRRTFSPEIRIVDANKGLVDYVASDETLDWYDEIVLASSWHFTHFAKNAPFVDSHSFDCIDKLLGKVLSAEIKNKQLVERVQWAIDVEENELAQVGWKMTVAGYLKAVSVGFMDIESIRRGQPGFDEIVTTLGKEDPSKYAAYRIFTKVEQIELSACILGANPNALAKSFSDRVIDEEDLSKLGFGTDDEKQFLVNAAKAYGDGDLVMRSMIELEMKRTFAARNFSGKPDPKAPGTSAQKRVAAEAAERRAATRADFLKALGVG